MKQRINQMLDNSEQLNKPPFIPIKWQEYFDKKCETSIFGYEVDCVKLKEYIEGIIKQETQSKNPKLSLCSDEPKVGKKNMNKEIEKAKWEIACLAMDNIKALPVYDVNTVKPGNLYIKRQDAVDALKSDRLPVIPGWYGEIDVNTVDIEKTKDNLSRN